MADPGGSYLTAVGQYCAFDGSGSSDPDGDSLGYAWDCGDGGTETGASAFHLYGFAGIYDVCLTVDDGSESDTECTYAVIYDPAGGFVTGGGSIDSPLGAYALDPTLSGRANFGFVSKYKQGATVPTGQTQFVFRAGDMDFHGNSYDWLVVNQAGTNAQFRGSGTINGAGDYKFMLWAKDDDPSYGDTFRIKIWTDPDEDNPVYDNGFDQPLGGGSIVVHVK